MRPLVTSGALLQAVLWGLAALVMPWLVRGRSLSVDIVAATVWAAGLAGATASLGAGRQRLRAQGAGGGRARRGHPRRGLALGLRHDRGT